MSLALDTLNASLQMRLSVLSSGSTIVGFFKTFVRADFCLGTEGNLNVLEVTPLLWTVYGFRIKPHLSASIHS